jgi:eukaryotic-like serine/threonine-protein kinase
VALASALRGDAPAAEATANALAKDFPDDTLLNQNFLPVMRAQFALALGHAAQALEELKAAEQCEKCQSTQGAYIWTAYYPPYVRGEAYLTARQPDKAAAEFQKIIDVPYLVLNEPIGALAQLGLARAYAMSGDREKAKSAYAEFLKLWANADPDVPVLVAAKAEYAKLN